MSTQHSRRALVLTAAGLFLLGSKGCGGGGGAEDSAPAPSPAPGGSPPAAGTGPTGFLWYDQSDELFKVERGTGEPQRVNRVMSDGRSGSIRGFRVSANSLRYLQIGNYGYGSDSGCMILYFDAASHAQQGFVDMNGYVVDARASPSGRYIAMVRAPDYINTLNQLDTENIAGLTVVDIADRQNPRALRESFGRDGAAVLQFAWHGDDQYTYMTLDGRLFGGTAAGGEAGDRQLGQFSSDTLIKGEFSLHPGGDSFLIKGWKSENEYDIYLCSIDGRIQRQMTAVGTGYRPLWSPDGSVFMFKVGREGTCTTPPVPGCDSCKAYYAPANVSSVTLPGATQFDPLVVPCLGDHYWTAV